MTENFNAELSHLITRLERSKKRSMRDVLAKNNLRISQSLFLTYIEHHPGSKQEDIANWLVVDKGAVARNAAKLEEMGYIRREVDPENRRGYRLFLTDRGLAASQEVNAERMKWSEELGKSLSEEERRQAVLLLIKMESSLNN